MRIEVAPMSITATTRSLTDATFLPPPVLLSRCLSGVSFGAEVRSGVELRFVVGSDFCEVFFFRVDFLEAVFLFDELGLNLLSHKLF